MRSAIAAIAGVVALALVNVAIAGKERILANGRVVYPELAPVDPRSLMQGDYMALRFRLIGDAQSGAFASGRDGRIVASVDSQSVARFRRFDDRQPLASDEIALRYRLRDGRLTLATNAYFFQEGTAGVYSRARYGEFRLAPNGDLLLVALCGPTLQRLGP